MIHATIRMTLPARKIKEALEILGSVAERTRVQPACISCRVYHDTQQDNVIMIDEIWRTQEELERHLQSNEYRNVLLVVEMAHEKPEIKFSEFSHSTGVETIEKAISEGKGGGRK
jgi:quinol monooxygenase YgiN